MPRRRGRGTEGTQALISCRDDVRGGKVGKDREDVKMG